VKSYTSIRGGLLIAAALLALTAPLASSQPLLLTQTCPATVHAGKTLTCTLTLTGTPAPAPASLQWTLNMPVGISPLITATVTGTAAAISAVVACNVLTTSTDVCVLYSLSINTLVNGPVTTIYYHFPKNWPPGKVWLDANAVLAASVTGDAVPIAGGPGVSVKVTQSLLGTVKAWFRRF